MNFVARALTQNLRDIRRNWAGSGPWLLRVGSSLLTLVGVGFLAELAADSILAGRSDLPTVLASHLVHSIVFGAGIAACFAIWHAEYRQRRSLLLSWFLWSIWGLMVNLELPGVASGVMFGWKIGAFALLVLAVIALRPLISKRRGEGR